MTGARAGRATASLDQARGERRLRLRLITAGDESLLVFREFGSSPLSPKALAAFLPISGREADVLAGLTAGRRNTAIADELGISPHTVGRHLERIYAKLGVQSRGEAVAAAFEAVVWR